MRQSQQMDVFRALDQRWTPLLVVCGLPLVLLGIVIRSLSVKRTFSWRIGDAALDLGVTLLAIAVVLHFVLPYVVAKATESFPGV